MLLAQDRSLQTAGVLLRKESFGDLDIQVNAHADRQQPSAASSATGFFSTTSSAAEYVEITHSKNCSVVR